MRKYALLLLFSSLTLWGIGLLTIRSIMPQQMPLHLLYGIIGIAVAAVVSRIDPAVYMSSRWLLYAISVVGLIATELFGVLSRGSTRWLTVFGFKFQTSEFAKAALCIFAAQTLVRWPFRTFNDVIKFGVVMSVPTLLIFIEPDLGTALMVGFLIISSIISSGFPFKKLLVLAIAFLLMMPVCLSLLKPYQKERLETFINPNSDPLGSGYNVRQASIAVGSGMLTGRGIGKGTQSHLKFLPERHTDFIFASYVEEFGFIGALFLLGMYVLFGLTTYRIARFARTAAETYICILVATIVVIQATINIGMNLGIIPVTGITLPLVSSGGSSLISTWLMIGLVLGVSLRIKKTYFELRCD